MPVSTDKIFDSKLQNQNVFNLQNESASFSDVFNKKLEEVNSAQKEADQLTENFMMGGPVEIHTMLIAMEKAELALRQTLEIRNKLVEAFKEIQHMQI
jgi:flagellar hook-basal body complex protein FliE